MRPEGCASGETTVTVPYGKSKEISNLITKWANLRFSAFPTPQLLPRLIALYCHTYGTTSPISTKYYGT